MSGTIYYEKSYVYGVCEYLPMDMASAPLAVFENTDDAEYFITTLEKEDQSYYILKFPMFKRQQENAK